jgi:hypothetical protein
MDYKIEKQVMHEHEHRDGAHIMTEERKYADGHFEYKNYYLRIDEDNESYNLSDVCDNNSEFPDCLGCNREQFFKCLDKAGRGIVPGLVSRIKNMFLRDSEQKKELRQERREERAVQKKQRALDEAVSKQLLPYKDNDDYPEDIFADLWDGKHETT